MKRSRVDYMITVIGIALLAIGLYLLRTLINPQGMMLTLPYVCIGFGCGIFGHSMANILSGRIMRGSPEIHKQIEIEKNDERNRAITNRAKAKAYDMMTFVFGAVMVSFALMGIELTAILLLVFVYLFVQGCGIYYRCKYDKEM